MFVGVDLSITWPNRLLALLGVINEGVLGGIPPSQQVRSATRADVTEERLTSRSKGQGPP